MEHIRFNPEHVHLDGGVLFVPHHTGAETIWCPLVFEPGKIPNVDFIYVKVRTGDEVIHGYYQVVELLTGWFDGGFYVDGLFNIINEVVRDYRIYCNHYSLPCPDHWVVQT